VSENDARTPDGTDAKDAVAAVDPASTDPRFPDESPAGPKASDDDAAGEPPDTVSPNTPG
jgi:hypothetical protein